MHSGRWLLLGPGRGRRDGGGLGAASVGWFDTGLQKIPARLTTNGGGRETGGSQTPPLRKTRDAQGEWRGAGRGASERGVPGCAQAGAQARRPGPQGTAAWATNIGSLGHKAHTVGRARGRFGIGPHSESSGEALRTMGRTTGRRAGLRRRPYARTGCGPEGGWLGGLGALVCGSRRFSE